MTHMLVIAIKRGPGANETTQGSGPAPTAPVRTLKRPPAGTCSDFENIQNEDGSVTIPEVLRVYVGKEKIEALLS
jgi:hypothetical protein